MNYGEKKRSGEMMYGPAPKVPAMPNTQEWDRYRGMFNRRAGRSDLVLSDGRGARFTGKHRALAKQCFCSTCNELRGNK